MVISNRSRYPRLLVRPTPAKGESLYGYLSRLAELNGLDGISWGVCSEGALSEAGKTPDETVQYLEEAAGLSEADVLALSYRLSRNSASGCCCFMGRTMRSEYFRSGRSVVCLACLNEHHSAPALWDFRLITACVRHKQWLLDRCPTCKVMLSLHRRSLKRCPRGHELKWNRGSGPTPPDAVLEFTQTLEEELRGDLRPAPGRSDDLVDIALTAFDRARKDISQGVGRLDLDASHMTATQHLDVLAVARIAPVVTNWPMPLFHLLRKERWGEADRNAFGCPDIHYANAHPIFERLLGGDIVQTACAQFTNLYRRDIGEQLYRRTRWMESAES
ncbi:TniQ protein [Cupriavidus metallidurans]